MVDIVSGVKDLKIVDYNSPPNNIKVLKNTKIEYEAKLFWFVE